MSARNREIMFLILQFLEEENMKDTVHMLEKESRLFFNWRYFEECIKEGNWDEAESYLSGFTKIDDNLHSTKIFFEIRKQKYLEALENCRNDRAKALEILQNDLKFLETTKEDLFQEFTCLLTMNDFREHRSLSEYNDSQTARAQMLLKLHSVIAAHPLLHDKLQFPNFGPSRLQVLMDHSLKWQHHLCKYPKVDPEINTLFADHDCGLPTGDDVAMALSPVGNPLMVFPPQVANTNTFQPTLLPVPELTLEPMTAPLPAPLPPPVPVSTFQGWVDATSTLPHQAISGGPIGLATPNNSGFELVPSLSRPIGTSEERRYQNFPYSDDIPSAVIAKLNQGSAVLTMDFHPTQQTLLLVGTNTGDIALWDVCSKERLAFSQFKVWDISSRSEFLWAALVDGYTVTVNRVIWNPDGNLFGAAYSKHLVQLYSYHGGDDIRTHLEIEAHIGKVNDLGFSSPNQQLCVITCGDDRTVKVWDATTGSHLFKFEGHQAPVHSICPHVKRDYDFIFSTSVDGKIKAWLYENGGPRGEYDAPGHCHSFMTMAYSANGERLFSCGTSSDGQSHLVEWNVNEGCVKRTYHGLANQSFEIVQFDTSKNKYLAAGDQFVIKFWDMENVNLLTVIDAGGGLQATPYIRFNKEGIFLAVSTRDNGIKILANAAGVRLMRFIESREVQTIPPRLSCELDPLRIASASVSSGPLINTILGASSSGVGMNSGLAQRNVRQY